MPKSLIISIFIEVLIMLPITSIASEPVPVLYSVRLHLTNNATLNGYIYTEWSLNACNEHKNDKLTWKSFFENLQEINPEGSDRTVKFINTLISIKFNKRFFPVASKSSVQSIKIENIKSIESVCKNWDGFPGIMVISDHMADYISGHNLIASYLYEESGANSFCVTTYLSYNPNYTKASLKKLRENIDKMPDDILDKENLIRVSECWD